MEYVAETIEYKGHTIKIIPDQDPESPRDWDNLGKMICFHKRHCLGDKTHLKSANYSGWDNLESYLRSDMGAALVLPLFLYDHSGLTISTAPFSCPWDSGQVGFIYATREALLKEYGVKRLTKAILEKAKTVLEGEVETYDQYLSGDVYGYVVEQDGEEIEDGSCWGMYGQEYCEKEARKQVDRLAARDLATVNGENVNGDGI